MGKSARKNDIVEEKSTVAVQLSMQLDEEPVCENPEQDIEKQIQESEQTVKNLKSKRKKILNILFFAFNIVLVAIILTVQISKETILPISELFAIIKPPFLILLFVVLGLSILLQTLIYAILIKASTKKNRFFLAYKVQAIGRYYDNITPMASGGQAFQIFYLNTHGVESSPSISIPMGSYIIGQFAWLLFCAAVIIISLVTKIGGSFSLIGILAIISTVANGILVAFILILSLNKRIGKKLVVNALKLLQKLKIVKNYEKQYIKVMKVVSDYQNIMKSFTTNMWLFVKVLILSIIRLITTYSLPFLIYCCFFGFNLTVYLEILCMTAMIDMAATFIPMPGGSGVTEISFTSLFSMIFGGVVFWAMLLWRIINYYLLLVQGIAVIIYDYLVGNKKFKWQQKQWELELESENFKQEQLKIYKKKKKEIFKIK